MMIDSFISKISDQWVRRYIIDIIFNMPEFITPQGLVELKNYKYHSGKYTYLDNALTGYWQGAVKLVPMWVAPNLITFVGFLLVILSYANMLRYDYTVEKDIPQWCFLLAAGCVWAYSTLDAIDGKQARRTKSSSPLGQLFDHGCDSFSTAFFILAVGQATKLQGLEIFMIFVASQMAFWTATWTEYNTGILRTNVGQIGVTQAHIFVTLIHLLTGIFGQSLWEVHLTDFLPGKIVSFFSNPIIREAFRLKLGGVIAIAFGILIFVLTFFQSLRTIIKSPNKLKAMSECLTMALIIIFQMVWIEFSFYDKYKGLVLLNFGLITSLVMCKAIIASVTKMKLQYFHPETLPLIIGTVFMILCEAFKLKSLEPTVFWGIFVANTFWILYFLHGVINQITQYLGIYCFSIKKQEAQKEQ